MFIAARREIDATDLHVTRQPVTGNVTIGLGADHLGFYIALDTPADCDALIAAVVAARRLLAPDPDPEPEPPGPLATPAADEPGPACLCGHQLGDHDDDTQAHECRRPGCGCGGWRTAAVAALQPPRVAQGDVLPFGLVAQ